MRFIAICWWSRGSSSRIRITLPRHLKIKNEVKTNWTFEGFVSCTSHSKTVQSSWCSTKYVVDCGMLGNSRCHRKVSWKMMAICCAVWTARCSWLIASWNPPYGPSMFVAIAAEEVMVAWTDMWNGYCLLSLHINLQNIRSCRRRPCAWVWPYRSVNCNVCLIRVTDGL
jgi:hypothetical protein